MMLNLKNVLYNFLYKNDGADGIADIIGSELGVNIALRRNFWWYRNILWASDLQVKKKKKIYIRKKNMYPEYPLGL